MTAAEKSSLADEEGSMSRKFGCDSIVMQGSGADDRKMLDQGFAGIVNFIDYATRRSFPYPEYLMISISYQVPITTIYI